MPKGDLAALFNLDQLLPLVALKIMTVHAIDDTTLAGNVRKLAAGMGIEIRPDMEVERNPNQRTDHFPFLRPDVPATNFTFGFDPGAEAERRYREWYQVRYHRPQDDLSRALDWGAVRDMNRVFSRLVEGVAQADARPAFAIGSGGKVRR
ncbi:MAG: M28 family peptidase [Hyphomonadaceae bacterium]